ncbi:hypothetical protein [Sphingobium olei]|uniref:Uncharacterized protein n=1 Tax=Sphingobium olei TaxID=420955 RepID=A0ABW3NYD4_9SPHN
MSEMLELAERVEALTGPNYAVEVEIFKALHPEYADYVQGRGGLVHRFDGSDQRVLSDIRPGNYTASLDSAMRLVPDGLKFEVTTTGYKPGATVCGNSLTGVHEGSYAATPALALCAAALRARHHLESSDAQG